MVVKFEVKESPINGRGLFATEPIQTGEVALRWNPKVLTKQEAEELPKGEREQHTYPDGERILWLRPPE
jgi:SET domain-containing protein